MFRMLRVHNIEIFFVPFFTQLLLAIKFPIRLLATLKNFVLNIDFSILLVDKIIYLYLKFYLKV